MKKGRTLRRAAAGILAAALLPCAACADEAARLEALSAVTQALEEGHAALKGARLPETWTDEAARLREAAATMDDDDFSYALMALAASLHDAHTQVYLTGTAAEERRLLPLALYDFDGALRVVTAPEELKAYLGWEVTALDGMPIGVVYERMSVLLSYDNEVYRRYLFASNVVDADALHYLGVIEDTGAVEMTLTGAQGETRSVTLKAYNQQERTGKAFVSVERAQIPLAEQAQQIYQQRALAEDALLVSYYACMEDEAYPIGNFAKELDKNVRENGYSCVIVDLRYNHGGNSDVFQPVIAVLKKLKKDKKIRLFTLIGEQTFSSALMNAVQLRDAGAVLVGRPTGGSVNHYGELGGFEAPSLSLAGTYSTKRFIMDKSYAGDSLCPDIVSPFRFEDYAAGYDGDVARALQAAREEAAE